MSEAPVLVLSDLRTYFFSRSKQAFIRSVDGVDLVLGKGESLGIVGESGSGKSVTALTLMGLLTADPGVITGRIEFSGRFVTRDLLRSLEDHVRLEVRDGRIMGVEKDTRRWQRVQEGLMADVRGREISMIFQNPKDAFNPFETIGAQISESIRLHTGIKGRREAAQKALYWLEQVKIDSPHLRYSNYPFGLSGGMCQRAMIAMALSSEPSLLVADEPTTGLDATIQAKIVELLANLQATVGVATMLISHDIHVVSRLSGRTAVMYGGRAMETGPTRQVLGAGAAAKHPYTAALLASIPTREHVKERGRLQAIEGDVLDTINIPRGCRFFSRCNRITPAVRERCKDQEPDLFPADGGGRIRCWLYER